MSRDAHSLMLSTQHFFCQPRVSLILQGVLKDDFGEDGVSFPSLNSCQKRLLWIHKEVDLAPHPLYDLVLKLGDAEMFPRAFGLKGLDPFFSRVSKQDPYKRLGEIELACKADYVSTPDPAIAQAILT